MAVLHQIIPLFVQVLSNPLRWQQCMLLACSQVVFACAVIGVSISSWKAYDCIQLTVH